MKKNSESEKISIDLKNLKFELTKPGKSSKTILIIVLCFYTVVIVALFLAIKLWAVPVIASGSFIPRITNPLKNLFGKKQGNSP